MALTQEEVKKIAKLAKLKLGADEIGLYQAQLLRILESMAELEKLDTKAVSPMTSTLTEAADVLREDEPELFADAAKLLENAPERDGPYFKVPKVVEG